MIATSKYHNLKKQLNSGLTITVQQVYFSLSYIKLQLQRQGVTSTLNHSIQFAGIFFTTDALDATIYAFRFKIIKKNIHNH